MKPSQIRRMVREYLGVGKCNQIPVGITEPFQFPKLTGERGGYFTRGGVRITYPSAYGRKGRSNMVYRRDTRIITVGQPWIEIRLLQIELGITNLHHLIVADYLEEKGYVEQGQLLRIHTLRLDNVPSSC